MARLQIRPAAAEDLRAVRVYGKQAFGAIAARKYFNSLRRAVKKLAANPFMGTAEPDLDEHMRSFGHPPHRIFYRVAAGTVQIVRVLHHARDVPSAFKPPQ